MLLHKIGIIDHELSIPHNSIIRTNIINAELFEHERFNHAKATQLILTNLGMKIVEHSK